MMLLRTSTPEFRLGFMVTALCFEAHFGWVGFIFVWKQVLETLPQMAMGPCLNCGATDWTAANPTDDRAGFKDCNKCNGYPGGPQEHTGTDSQGRKDG